MIILKLRIRWTKLVTTGEILDGNIDENNQNKANDRYS